MKYKVGNKVRIKSLDWYNKNKDSNGNIVFSSKVLHFSWCENVRTVFTKDMVKFCGKVVTIGNVWTVNYSIVEGTYRDYFTDEMIEGIVEEEINQENDLNMKYKVGNKVRVKSINWYNQNKDEIGVVKCGDYTFTYPMTKLCGKTVTVTCVNTKDRYYVISEDDGYNSWTDEMIGGIVEEKTKFGTASNPIEPKSNANCLTQERTDELSLDKAGQITDFEYEGLAYTLPDGYVFKDENGNVINTTKIVLEKKKKEYPRTYKECCRVLGVSEFEYNHTGTNVWYKHKLMSTLDKLILCRNAYWKLYGEEMGLGKPWEPDWRHGKDKFYCISTSEGEIVLGEWYIDNKILAFPTAEMRNYFYQYFKELIEQCKELL